VKEVDGRGDPVGAWGKSDSTFFPFILVNCSLQAVESKEHHMRGTRSDAAVSRVFVKMLPIDCVQAVRYQTQRSAFRDADKVSVSVRLDSVGIPRVAVSCQLECFRMVSGLRALRVQVPQDADGKYQNRNGRP
jgi:hypothetical protein